MGLVIAHSAEHCGVVTYYSDIAKASTLCREDLLRYKPQTTSTFHWSSSGVNPKYSFTGITTAALYNHNGLTLLPLLCIAG